jgi:TetR/AcrR family transcriptional regulator
MDKQKLTIARREVIQRRRNREKDQRIQSILEASKKVFFSKGYLKATMDEIALEAEISKPTIYQYFKTKDDLYFSLMLPVVEDIGKQAEKIENRLLAGKYADGGQLIRDWFRGLFHSYQIAPDTFRIIQLFQQTGLVAELDMERRIALNEKGGYNFRLFRRITEKAIKQGLIKKVNVFQFVDAVWGLFVGIIQLEDVKSKDKGSNRYLQPTLKLAENMVSDAIILKKKKICV